MVRREEVSRRKEVLPRSRCCLRLQYVGISCFRNSLKNSNRLLFAAVYVRLFYFFKLLLKDCLSKTCLMFSSILSRATRTQKLLLGITALSFMYALGFLQISGTRNLRVTSPSNLYDKFTNQLRCECRRNVLNLIKVAVFYRCRESAES